MTAFVRRSRAIAHKELIHMLRDTRVLYLALGLPVVMLALFGYAVSLDVDHIPFAVVDQDGTRASRRLAEGLAAGGVFVRKTDLASPDQADPLFRRGRIKALLVLPRGYQRDLQRGADTGAQLLLDGSDGSLAAVAMGDALGIAAALAPNGRASVQGALAAGPPIRIRFNPAMRSAYSIVPGVIVMILGMVLTLLTALTVAREWERGNMEQLFATPVRRSEVIVGKLVPYAGLGMVQTLLILTLGSWLFRVPIVGSLTMLFGSSFLFVLCMIGIGLFVSVATRNQLIAVQLSAMLGYMPAMLLSGFMFPIANMPAWLQILASAFPARYYLSALRGILLKGNGVDVLAPQLAALAFAALATLTLAVGKFRRRLA